MQRLLVLGSTGSIGRNTLDVVRRIGNFRIVGLTCNRNIDALRRQIHEFKPDSVCVGNSKLADALKGEFPNLEVLYGLDGLIKLIEKSDFVVNALVGTVGLLPTYHAIALRKRLALANKESLVIAGSILKRLAEKNGVEIVPIDSEHSAIYQCLRCEKVEQVSKIILTASGGPFLHREDFSEITKEDALNHPNWNMGKKITIDSATMMNKCFEIIEARWLFDVPYNKIDVVIHPESIIHSMVEFVDGSIIAQIAEHDMRIPIAYALYRPERVQLPFKIDLTEIGKLTFLNPDFDRFPTLGYAYETLKNSDKNMGLVLNVADEIAVDAFLKDRIRFCEIFDIIKRALDLFVDDMPDTIDGVLRQIEQVKAGVNELVSKDFGGLR